MRDYSREIAYTINVHLHYKQFHFIFEEVIADLGELPETIVTIIEVIVEDHT